MSRKSGSTVRSWRMTSSSGYAQYGESSESEDSLSGDGWAGGRRGGETTLTSHEMGSTLQVPKAIVEERARTEELAGKAGDLSALEMLDKEELRKHLQQVTLHLMSQALRRDKGGEVREHIKVLLDISGLRVNKVAVGVTKEGWTADDLKAFRVAAKAGSMELPKALPADSGRDEL